jgi:peptidoglycan/xylan/chitin deacetylase (PgdA/CDA1 family)
MSWDQLLGLDPRWVTVGSHTVSHPIMTSLPAAELEHELEHSRAWLEQRLQRPVEHFCYPNGSESPIVRQAAARHYVSAVTTQAGYMHADTDRHGIPRLDGDPRPVKMSWNLHRAYPSK